MMRQTYPIIMIFVDIKKLAHPISCLSEERISQAYQIYLYKLILRTHVRACVYAVCTDMVCAVLYFEKEKGETALGVEGFFMLNFDARNDVLILKSLGFPLNGHIMINPPTSLIMFFPNCVRTPFVWSIQVCTMQYSLQLHCFYVLLDSNQKEDFRQLHLSNLLVHALTCFAARARTS